MPLLETTATRFTGCRLVQGTLEIKITRKWKDNTLGTCAKHKRWLKSLAQGREHRRAFLQQKYVRTETLKAKMVSHDLKLHSIPS